MRPPSAGGGQRRARFCRGSDFQTIELERRPVALADLVDATVRIVRVAAQEKFQRLEVAVDPGLTASLDERLIRQALLNLLGNAVKFTPLHGLIRIDASRASDNVLAPGGGR